MHYRRLIVLMLMLFPSFLKAQTTLKDSANIKKISNYILTQAACYNDLRDLCKNIGHRISGSPQAAKAVIWAKSVLENAGCDKVYLQEVMVPHWVRGKEEARINYANGHYSPIVISSLGNAVGTGEQGLSAPIIMVQDMNEFNLLNTDQVKGKIIFFNHKFTQTNINTFDSYGPCVYYRWATPTEASRKGAVAVVIRSVSSAYDDKPHTGSLHYDEKVPSIPAVAISNVDADNLEQLCNGSKKVSMFLKTTCEMLPDVKSYNVIGEVTGYDEPNEIICIGGHLDSWDIGEGAHDDGAGVVQCIEVLRAFKKCGIRPKRTIRTVLFMNEENGLRGGKKYADIAVEKQEKHVVAIESDAGGATPMGFSMTMANEKREKIKSWKNILLPYGLWRFDFEGGGADIGPLHKQMGTPVMELTPDSQRYFDMHHSANDVFENVHRRELCLGAIAMSAMVYLISEYGL